MIQVYDENRIKSETKAVLYWMSKAAKYIKEGNARMAHLALTTALNHDVEIALAQEKLLTKNNYEKDESVNYSEIYATALYYAQKEAWGEDK